MSIHTKTPEEIEKMRVAGRLAAEVLQIVAPHVKPGVTTEELDRICHDHIIRVQQAIPANVGYKGYPKTTCISANNVICHGIPSESKVLKDGDIINIDVTVIKDGWHGMRAGAMLREMPPTLHRREVSVELRDARTQQVVYETSALFEDVWTDDPAVFGVLFDAALSGFPQPPQGPRQVRLPLAPTGAPR